MLYGHYLREYLVGLQEGELSIHTKKETIHHSQYSLTEAFGSQLS